MPETAPFDLSLSKDQFDPQFRFATPFVVAPLNAPEPLNAALRDVILDRAASHPSTQVSNHGGWQSDTAFAEWSGPAGKALLAIACKLADSLTAVQTPEGLVAGAPAWQVNAWANLNRAGDSNRAHHHPAAFWSGVYWVDVGPEGDSSGGEFEMHDPRGVLPAFYAPRLRYALAGCLSAGGQDFFTPTAGVLALFPSWLVHAVRPYTGPGERISIAFNLSV